MSALIAVYIQHLKKRPVRRDRCVVLIKRGHLKTIKIQIEKKTKQNNYVHNVTSYARDTWEPGLKYWNGRL